MKARIRIMLTIAGLGLMLAACGGGTPTVSPTPTPVPCDPSLLVMPMPTTPPWGGIWDIGYSSLEWTYPITTCDPEHYVIELNTQYDFSGPNLGGATGSPGTSWGPSATLDPATIYYWRVRATTMGTLGPWSNISSFVTGPVCDMVGIAAPLRVEPLDGDTLATVNPRYDWSYPDTSCTPTGYHIRIYDSADLSSWVMEMDDSEMATPGFWPGVPLDDCGTYYWHVAAKIDAAEGPFSTVGSFSLDASGTCTCTAAELVQPVPVWPSHYEIVPDLLPILEWSNPATCNPEGYAVHLSTEHDMSDTSLFGGTGSPSTTWMPGPTLDPATQYWWEVAAGVGTDFGPYSPKRSFFTGPECTSITEVMAPERLAPEDGALLDELYAKLRYTPGEPGCIPDGYLLDLQTDPAFSGANLLTEYGFPGTTVFTDPLDDCTLYYWRVAAVQDGSYGPYSDTGWFFTDELGTCPVPLARGLLLGNVYCRLGTSTDFRAVFSFNEGDWAEIEGRNADGTYLVFRIPGTRRTCWTPRSYAEIFGDEENMRIFFEPELPAPEPTKPVCTKDLPKDLCLQAGGKWVPSMVAAGGYCECPK
jgi:hypothetical protein